MWELVGIDLEKAKEAGGNAGAIVSAIKSPQAVPWALMILVAYFSVFCRRLLVQISSSNQTKDGLQVEKQNLSACYQIESGYEGKGEFSRLTQSPARTNRKHTQHRRRCVEQN